MIMEKKLSSTSTRLTNKLFWENSQSSLKWLGVRYYSLLILWTMKRKDYFGIFNSWDCYDEEIQKETREMLAECNDIPVEEVSDDWVYESISDWLENEKANLDKELDGTIIAFANVGLWYGRRTGYKVVGSNLSDILQSFYGGDECEFYADKYNVYARAAHHDGTNFITFRIVDSEKVDKLCDDIYNGKIDSREKLFRKTKSIRPFIAKIYGWKQFGRHAAT